MLTYLYINSGNITDISCFSNLGSGTVTDISCLSNIKTLRELRLYCPKVKSFNGIFSQVKTLHVTEKLVADLARTGDGILADKKVTWVEALQVVPQLMQLPNLLPVFPLAKTEWIGADAESKADAIAYANEKFDFANENVEVKVEAAFGVVIHIGTLLQ